MRFSGPVVEDIRHTEILKHFGAQVSVKIRYGSGMLLLKALRNRAVSRLWIGQVGSAIGDEIYRVAFIWLAVDLIGANTGYLASLQYLVILIFGVFGGKWADRYTPYQTMIRVDLIRALITLTPVFLFYLHRPSFPALVVSSMILAGLGAFFEPAMQSVLPVVAKDAATLKAANGLMSTTLRLARVMGPAIIGLLSTVVASVHFFTLNSFSYLFSALSVISIKKDIPKIENVHRHDKEHILSSFLLGFRKTRSNPIIYRSMMAKATNAGAWGLVYGLGIALLIHEMSPKNVKAFGMVMGAYGIGNVISAIGFGSYERKHPERLIYLGLLWLGVCFVIMSITTSFPLLLLITAITAVGGPMNDLPFYDLVQREYAIADLPRIFRIRMIFENLFTLLFMLVSPFLFHHFPIRTVIMGCGVFGLIISCYGLIKVSPDPSPASHPERS